MANSASVRERVVAVLIEASDAEIQAEQVSDETSLTDDLDLTSLQAVMMVMDLEEDFGIAVEDEELEALATVGDVLKIIQAKIAESG